MQSLQIGIGRSEMPNTYGLPYGCVQKSVWDYRLHWGKKDQELWHLLDQSQWVLDYMKGNSIRKNFFITYFAVKQYLQGDNGVCKSSLWTKAFCCARMCASRLSGQTMRSPAVVYVQTIR